MGKKSSLEEIRGKDSRELQYDLREIKKQLFETRFQIQSDSAKPSSIRNMRRRIARLLTVLAERQGEALASEGSVSEGRVES